MNRGSIGLLPRPDKLEDESYLDFVESFRKVIIQDMFPALAGNAMPRYAAWKEKNKPNANRDDLDDVKRVFREAPVTLAWQRFLRTQQEMMWRKTRESALRQADVHLTEIEAAESKGPGRLIYDADYTIPNYTRQEIHLQPGGYTDDPIGGLVFHYGTKVFYEGTNDQDELHYELAEKMVKPEDGKCDRILDIACSIGQGTIALKEKNPDAEVTGFDIALPMLKYAHYYAVQRNVDVTFKQGLAEDTGYDENSFDAVMSYLLYHEVAEEKINEIVTEIHRILRPGGVFTIYDFPNNYGESLDPAYRFLIDFDSKNNCEPYSVGFVHCDFKGMLEKAGFKVEDGPQTSNPFLQTIKATKL